MLEAQMLQLGTFNRTQNAVLGDVRALQHALHQVFRQDQRTAFNLYQRVVELRREGDRTVGRQGPWRGGPDHQRDWAFDAWQTKFALQRFLIDAFEGHIDGWRGFVVILNFRLSQRRTAVHAPVHRLGAFVQMAVTDDFTQRTNDVGFGFEVHGQVRMRPVAQHAQTDKVFTLTVNLGGSVFAAFRAEFSCGELLAWLTELLLYFQLNWQTVTVPAWNVRRVKAHEAFGLHDNVFQNLVYRVTNMNAAIRIRRAIMQNEGFFAFFGCTDDAVQVIIGPTRQHSRFTLGEVAAHREPCFRQIQG